MHICLRTRCIVVGTSHFPVKNKSYNVRGSHAIGHFESCQFINRLDLTEC